MSDDAIRLNVSGGVGRITMARPQKHNAFDDGLIADLSAAFEAAGRDDAVRVVVLEGEGKSFSAGADLGWMQRMADYSDAENLADARKLAGMMRILNELPRPTIARVQGAAFGGGVGLVATCDIAFASQAASFCLSEARLGLIPSVISPYVVEAIGARAARRYFQTAERFDAETARALGLVHEVVPHERLDGRLEELIGTLLDNGPAAMAASKDLIRRVASGPVDDAMVEDTAQRIADIRATDEGREGVQAFLEKRGPNWQTTTKA
ncbi:MAG: enoyl-CoA hydratase/isomerase family protein [Rhodospirillaceae bacterium]|jgi:methylglutaconyl-CoA hydratase|nr:enoyl-CoA hydratase/isomerase family protein [Rhodospirillaceae bacterium]MBT3808103.1 enoyl-CoA hydratase/isomerase family protein [Rhodospirillaceae bacterium]MBT3931499.1 enoyl-CoA hydratase/isomerase family protein [Rhodospirillaceae bacterium]MBT4771977.1 enoyl-CoA hydratase/isomerase family protein [Rhodospirillaceae bacterium]MBT5357282.1 enoyl-CoA hydratase/isomerase family protein [Rhodospirillaceae bacterium]